MISLKTFIEEVNGKRIDEQTAWIDVLEYIDGLLPDLTFPLYQNTVNKHDKLLYATICSIKELKRAKASIISFLMNASLYPKEIFVVSDGTWNEEEGKANFGKMASIVRFISWEDLIPKIEPLIPSLTHWALKQIWGRKLLTILALSFDSPLLFADSDILWFNTPLSPNEIEGISLKLSTDNSHNYDQNYINNFKMGILNNTLNPVNCGVVFIKNCMNLITDRAMECIKYESQNPGKYSEQTFFAILNLDYSDMWTNHEIISSIDDIIADFNKSLPIQNAYIARHYVWRLKWVFWKDYIKMRLALWK